ncbi:MAG: hypothetical protein IJO98_01615 [Clostridia bacterium]|nr:hypothetical protein [Clostridia bacterium]
MNNNDREILRALAGEQAEIAALPIQKETEKLYRGVNNLKMIRPVVLLDEIPWNQIKDDALTLRCEDPFLREVEGNLRRSLYKWRHFPGDMLVEPTYNLAREIHVGGLGPKVIEQTLEADRGNNIISHHYEDQLSTFESLEILQPPEIIVDDALTEKKRGTLTEIFGDLLPVRTVGLNHAGFYMPWDDLSRWRGVEAIYMDLYDNPELLHAFVRRYLDIRKDLLDREEKMGLLDDHMPVLHCTAGLVDDLPGEKPDGKVTRRNMWGRGTAQLFASVSPAMHDEFEMEYAKEYFEGFGLVYYGCCEPLHDKIDICKKLPNLRKLSITPWADVRKSAERIGSSYVLSRKPNPAAVAVPHLDEDELRKDILETLTVCRENNTPCEFIIKDISSICYNPNNLTRWSEVVLDTVKNF